MARMIKSEYHAVPRKKVKARIVALMFCSIPGTCAHGSGHVDPIGQHNWQPYSSNLHETLETPVDCIYAKGGIAVVRYLSFC